MTPPSNPERCEELHHARSCILPRLKAGRRRDAGPLGRNDPTAALFREGISSERPFPCSPFSIQEMRLDGDVTLGLFCQVADKRNFYQREAPGRLTRTAHVRPTRTDDGKDCARSTLHNSLNSTSRPACGAATSAQSQKAPFLARRCKFRCRSQRAGRSRTPTVVHVMPGSPAHSSPKLRPSFP